MPDARTSTDTGLARMVPLALVSAGIVGTSALGWFVGPATASLWLGGTTLLGGILFFWTSLRFLSGEAELSPDLAHADARRAVRDALVARKEMLLRAIKDLENERSYGKIDAGDHESLASTYRAELKDVMKRMDAKVAPNRARAEALASKHLQHAVIAESHEPKDSAVAPAAQHRRECPSCDASNESDARFCKSCGSDLTSEKASS